MEKFRNEITTDVSRDAQGEAEMADDVRTLKDLEMALVGGGSDGVPVWS